MANINMDTISKTALHHERSISSHDGSQDLEKPVSGRPLLPEIDHAAERKLVRKLDLYIMPLFFYLYMLCFLDR